MGALVAPNAGFRDAELRRYAALGLPGHDQAVNFGSFL